jgi:selenocysteine lyase/cysteine desulfurase
LLASALNLDANDEVIVTDLDFPAGATPWLRAVQTPRLRLWKAADGELHNADLLPLLNERTKLVQVSLVSFYNGHHIDWQPFRDSVRQLAPNALISVDITQALGRIPLDCADADILISSTHKWTLGVHGGCIIGIPSKNAERLTTHAGGWYHLVNAFDADRFQRAVTKTGALSFSVGMPNFAALYALNAALRYVHSVGISAISAQADPLVQQVYHGLIHLGIRPLCPLHESRPTGIVAFLHEKSAEIHSALEQAEIHVMHNAGRLRIAVHGYNRAEDIQRALAQLQRTV